jgi:Mn-dependent DtxR family transcriptional regulator
VRDAQDKIMELSGKVETLDDIAMKNIDDRIEILTTGGNQYLGGNDFDDVCIDLLIEKLKEDDENIEEYLEVLYRNGSNKEQVPTIQLSKELNIAPGSVTQMLKKLGKLGYIIYTPYKGATLTDEGMEIAQKITRKHRILEKFLSDVLKVKEENIHDQACEMEHTLSDEAERALCNMLQNPDLCPDDNVIPSCNFDFDNCQQCYSLNDFDDIVYSQSNLLCISELMIPWKSYGRTVSLWDATTKPKLSNALAIVCAASITS